MHALVRVPKEHDALVRVPKEHDALLRFPCHFLLNLDTAICKHMYRVKVVENEKADSKTEAGSRLCFIVHF